MPLARRPSFKIFVIVIFNQNICLNNFLRNSASSFHWLSRSIFNVCLFVRSLSRIGNTSSHLHYMMFQTIQTIYFLWGYDPGNMSVSTYPHCWVEPSLLLSSFCFALKMKENARALIFAAVCRVQCVQCSVCSVECVIWRDQCAFGVFSVTSVCSVCSVQVWSVRERTARPLLMNTNDLAHGRPPLLAGPSLSFSLSSFTSCLSSSSSSSLSVISPSWWIQTTWHMGDHLCCSAQWDRI